MRLKNVKLLLVILIKIVFKNNPTEYPFFSIKS